MRLGLQGPRGSQLLSGRGYFSIAYTIMFTFLRRSAQPSAHTHFENCLTWFLCRRAEFSSIIMGNIIRSSPAPGLCEAGYWPAGTAADWAFWDDGALAYIRREWPTPAEIHAKRAQVGYA